MSRLIKLAILAAIAWGIYNWWNSGPRVILPNSNSQQMPTPAPQTPSPPPSDFKPAPALSPPPPPSADLLAKLAQAKSLVADKTLALTQAKAPILTALQSQADYKQAKSDADALQQQVRVARDRGDDNLSDLSNQWLAAKNKVTGMEATAFEKAPAVQQAADDLYKAQEAEAEIEKQVSGKGGVLKH